MPAALLKFNQFTQDLATKVHNLGTDALKIAFTNTAPVATNKVLADIAQIAAGNGYAAGGLGITTTSALQTGGVLKLLLANATFTAAGGSVGPFRYAVLYNSTPAGGPLIGWYDYGSAITLADAESLALNFDQANGALSLT